MTESLVIKENVVFQKVNDITTERAKWLASFVIDFETFDQFLDKLTIDVKRAQIVAETIVGKYDGANESDYRSTFVALSKEINYLNESRLLITDRVMQLRSIKQRHKRSLIPIIGQIASWAFGLVSDADLANIRSHISDLARNQNKVIHVVEQSISVLNESVIHIRENRQSIMEMISSIHELDTRLKLITAGIEKELAATKLFLGMYIQLDLIIDEIKSMLQSAMFYLEHLRSQINFLSLGKVSPSLISPNSLRSLLLTIKSQLPPLITLIGDPDTELWLFYRYLSSMALFERDKIIIILTIPTLRVDKAYEVYKAISIPIPMVSREDSDTYNNDADRTDTYQRPDMLATYDLESEVFLIDKHRNHYVLLTSEEIAMCANPHTKWCSISSPVFPVNLATQCVINLFMKNDVAIQDSCQATVSTNNKLPIAKHLTGQTWVIASNRKLTFALVCNDKHMGDVTVQYPLDVIQLSDKCVASNKYFTLVAPYVINSPVELSNNEIDLLREVNWTSSLVWSPFVKTFPKFPELKLPEPLDNIKEFPLDTLIDELQTMNQVKVKKGNPWPLRTYFTLIVGGLSLVLSLILIFYVYAFKKWGQKMGIRLCLSIMCGCNAAKQRKAEDKPAVTCVGRQSCLDRGNVPSTLVETEDIMKRLYPVLDEVTRL